MKLPCSQCGRPESEVRQYGQCFRGGKPYPNLLHTCDRCDRAMEHERRESQRD